jgi:glucose dehydrogenase
MKCKRTILRRTSTALTLAAMLLVASAGKAAGPVDTDWRSYNGMVNGQRYSPLDQITVQNVASLTEVCRFKVDDSGTFQAGLVQIEGTLYLTNAHDTLAVDATNCTRSRRHDDASERPVWGVNALLLDWRCQFRPRRR